MQGSVGEAIAYEPPTNENDGKLYISLHSSIGVYEVPSIDETGDMDTFSSENTTSAEENILLQSQYTLNRKLLVRGLSKNLDKKISSMQYFENVLYILFDNARTIRGYNLQTGEIITDMKVPKVSADGEFDRQWEGMFFERIKVKNKDGDSQNIRGSNADDSIVKLHMTLDTPPEIWTFTLTESKRTHLQTDLHSSVFAFPKCAAAV